MKTKITVGKRKKAIARCTVKKGNGRIFVNNIPVENKYTEVQRMLITEPLMLLDTNDWKSYDFYVNVNGGGISGQAQAVRQSIAKMLVELFGKNVKKMFIAYDRNMLIFDPRRTEPHKPSRSSQGPRRRKQLSKR